MENKKKHGINAVLVISRRAQTIAFILLIALIFYAVNCPASRGNGDNEASSHIQCRDGEQKGGAYIQRGVG